MFVENTHNYLWNFLYNCYLLSIDKNRKQWYNNKAVERERKNPEKRRFWTLGNKSAEVFLKRL